MHIFLRAIAIILLSSGICYAQEQITGTDEQNLTILNNELRKSTESIYDLNSSKYKVAGSSTDTSPNYLSSKVAKSVVVSSNKLELSGDSATPGNSKYYGTDAAGTKGFNSIPVDTVFTYRGDVAAVDKSLWTDDAHYHDWDLSGIVSSGAQAVLLLLYFDSTGNVRNLEMGRNADDKDANFSVTLDGVWQGTAIIPCSTNRVIKYKISGSANSLSATVIGWWN